MTKIILVVAVAIALVFFLLRGAGGGKAAAENQQKGTAFMLDNQAREGVLTTASGLQYQRLVEGSGKVHPAANAVVKVHYHGTLIDGTVFDSSVQRGSQ